MKEPPKKTAPVSKNKNSKKTALPKKKTVAAASASSKKASAKPVVKNSVAKKTVKTVKAAKSAAKKSIKKTVKKTVKTVKKADVKTSAVKKSAGKITGKVLSKPAAEKSVVKSVVKNIAKSPAKLTKPVKTATKITSANNSLKNTVAKKIPGAEIPAVKPLPEPPRIQINTFLPPEKPEGSFSPVEPVQKKIVKDVYSAEELKVFEQKLRTLRSQLRGDFNSMTDAALSQSTIETSGSSSSAPTHPADVGTDNFEQEQTFAFIQYRSERLEDIDDALERIKDGTYGVCESCNCKIPKARLNYLPYVTMCVKCTEIAEREA